MNDPRIHSLGPNFIRMDFEDCLMFMKELFEFKLIEKVYSVKCIPSTVWILQIEWRATLADFAVKSNQFLNSRKQDRLVRWSCPETWMKFIELILDLIPCSALWFPMGFWGMLQTWLFQVYPRWGLQCCGSSGAKFHLLSALLVLMPAISEWGKQHFLLSGSWNGT